MLSLHKQNGTNEIANAMAIYATSILLLNFDTRFNCCTTIMNAILTNIVKSHAHCRRIKFIA